MSKKAQRGEGKYSGQRRKKGNQQDFPATAQSKPVSAVSAPPAKVPAQGAKLSFTQHKYIANELRRIAILSGTMLVILVVLALAIP